MAQRLSGYGKIIAVLDEMIGSQPRGVRELSETTGIARSSVGKILQDLAGADVAHAGVGGFYAEGPRLQTLLHTLQERHPLMSEARKRLSALGQDLSRSAVLAIYEPNQKRAFIASSYWHPHPVEYALEVGDAVPLHAGASGQAIVMAVGSEIVDSQDLVELTGSTVTRQNELESIVAAAREDGFVISVGQHFQLAAGVATPFRGYGLTGSISITAPRYMTSLEELREIGLLLRNVAREIEAAAKRSMSKRQVAIDQPEGSTAAARFARLISLIIATGSGQAWTSRELSEGISASPAAVRNLVNEAVQHGVLIRSGRQLLVGPRLLRWSARTVSARTIAEFAEPYLQRLSSETSETIGLAVYDASTRSAKFSRVVKGVLPLSYGLSVGSDVPLHAGAAGKAILAHCPSEVLADLTLTRFTPRTSLTIGDLDRELSIIATVGYAIGDGERVPDAFGIGAPFFRNDEIAGAITITIARQHRANVDIDDLTHKVQKAAFNLSQILSVETVLCKLTPG